VSLEVIAVAPSKEAPAQSTGKREELVRRVASSVTFEKSPRLRAFLLHVCRCAIDDKPEEATEQQIGIHVYGRAPSYNQNDDNIVRSQARVLRMKLEHHFASEGKDEPVVIKIPKGHYLPTFESRSVEPLPESHIPLPVKQKTRRWRWVLPALALLFSIPLIWFGKLIFKPRLVSTPSNIVPVGNAQAQPDAERETRRQRIILAAEAGELRIAAGHTKTAYVDVRGHRWEADRYYEGGDVRPGPKHIFPPVADAGQFMFMREAFSDNIMVPQSQREFQYNIPVPSGVYELRLYFADPLRQPDADPKEDSQNERHFQVNLNGHPLLQVLDPITDAGSAAVDVRVFKDVHPAADGEIHLQFRSGCGHQFRSGCGRAFVSALELTPGIRGKLKPIRISARPSDFTDEDGTHWSGDNFFIDGRTWIYENPPRGPRIPTLYSGERHGNFSYSIPVVPGSYTVKLHFLESFFSPLIPAANCQGVGCRVFDVTSNGVMLLEDFDVFQAAGGAFLPVVREFHGLHPNGQGKLQLSFSPTVNYAEIRAIEVIDEAK
jgi:hypothetical protein